MYGYYYFDWTYILVIIGAVICMAASAQVQSTYRRYSTVRSSCGMTGAMAAQEILNRNSVTDVHIEHVRGELTDHYDPQAGAVRLSDAVYGSTSVAAIGVAAHECGHVMQHERGYVPLQIRTALVPVANFGSNVGIWVVILGLILGLSDTFVNIGTAETITYVSGNDHSAKTVKGVSITGNVFGGGLGETASVSGNTNVQVGRKIQ